MRRIYIKAKNCVVGMKLAEDLCTETGVCLIPRGTYITESLEKKIRRFKIKPIKVEVPDDMNVDELIDFDTTVVKMEIKDRVVKAYNASKTSVKEILDDLHKGKCINTRKVNYTIGVLKDNIKDSLDVLKCIDCIKKVDEYTYTHCVNVSMLSMTLAKWLGFSEEEINDVAKAGLLHDIGKTKISLDILNKNGSLEDSEYNEIKKHSTISYRILEHINNVNKSIKIGVLMHHERVDGSGYPLGAKDTQIHKYAKVIAIADVYDAMTSNRTYKKRKSIFDVLRTLLDLNGKLDVLYTRTFIERVMSHYVGDHVVLSTGETGQIVYINPRDILKPIVKVDNTYVDLSLERDIELEDLLWYYSIEDKNLI